MHKLQTSEKLLDKSKESVVEYNLGVVMIRVAIKNFILLFFLLSAAVYMGRKFKKARYINSEQLKKYKGVSK